MRPLSIRLLVLSVLLFWAVALSVPAISMNASAAGISGTWVSRIPGEGYTQSYIGPYGTLVTDEFDVELELSESAGVVTGTLKAWQTEGVQEFTVTGTVSGSVFTMTAYYGWDGVSYLTPVYTLTIEGNQMFGSGSYVNVGVTITGTFDLEKEGGLLALDLGLDFLVEYNDYITVVVIVVAVTGMAVGSLPVVPKGLKLPPLEPSKTGETGPMAIGMPEAGQPVGGIGLHTPAPPPAGRPLPPSEHFEKVSQQPPACPVHPGTFLVPHFKTGMPGEKGAWYCPVCNGYPWGESPEGR